MMKEEYHRIRESLDISGVSYENTCGTQGSRKTDTMAEIIAEMMDFEKPSLKMRETLVKQKKRSNSIDAPGPAFHEKKEKNKKVNKRYDHKKAVY